MRLNGIHREGEAEAPTLVLLHGLGADEHDLMPLAGELDPRLTVVSLRAPLQTGYGGFAWFPIEFHPDGSRTFGEAEAEANCELLIKDLEELSGRGNLILGGFSQGAMMTAGVLIRRPDLLDAAWLMSGRLLPVFRENGESLIHRPVLVQHGVYDDLVPIADGRELAAKLRSIGHSVEFSEYGIGHGIDYGELNDARRWIDCNV